MTRVQTHLYLVLTLLNGIPLVGMPILLGFYAIAGGSNFRVYIEVFGLEALFIVFAHGSWKGFKNTMEDGRKADGKN